jgi:extracellular factor (EF) 3-hydroxypalmitic acid methyl ester biosynthesis protein
MCRWTSWSRKSALDLRCAGSLDREGTTLVVPNLTKIRNAYMTALAQVGDRKVCAEIVEGLEALAVDLAKNDLRRLSPMVATLTAVRQRIDVAEWKTICTEVVRSHPAITLLMQEPLTRRALEKPRGYAGDAVMLDLMYGEGPPPEGLSSLGLQLYLWAVRQPACLSARYRRDMLAAAIDEAVEQTGRPRILSVACGHLREASRSYAVRAGGVKEIIAFDQDQLSLDEAARSLGAICTTIQGSVRSLFTGVPFGEFDLIYSAGLYDYLSDRAATMLTRALSNALRPGGRLLLGNFAPELRDIGYMEAIMDWYMTHRSESDMVRILGSSADLADVRTFRDGPGNVVYLDVRRSR